MGHINSGDTAWVLASAALVMLMTPALGFFYAGLVRRKNVLSTLMYSFIALCAISVQWVLWGYTLAFGPDQHHLIGGLAWVGLSGVGAAPNSDYAPTIPHAAFALFQMMFAVITPALITGGFAERKRFAPFVLFTLLWATFVYDPIAHWVWGHAVGLRISAPSILRAARSSTFHPALRRSFARGCSGRASRMSRMNHTTVA